MTIAEALRILELTPPITRQQLSQAYQQAQVVWCVGRYEGNLDLIAKARAKNAEIKAANALLEGLPDNGPPFHESAAPSAGRSAVPQASASRKRGVPKMAIMRQQQAQTPPQAAPPTRGKTRSAMTALVGCGLLASALGGGWMLYRQQQAQGSQAATTADAKPKAPAAEPPSPAPTPAPAPAPGTGKTTAELPTPELRAKAEQGDADAMFELGYRYMEGKQGVAKDPTAAVVWWRKAADKGHRDAQYHAAYAYGNGEGVAKDETEAMKWMRKAADQGHPDAQYSLGYDYYEGQHGLPKDPAQAIPWLTKAAEQGQDQAQTCLAQAYQQGNGVGKDEARALEWLKKAAAQDHAVAEYELGLAHARGTLGLKEDAEAAVDLLIKSAEQGLAEAQMELATLYKTGGQGLMPDFQESLIWYLIAAAEDKSAKEKSEPVKEELTLTEVSEAEEFAAEFKPRPQRRKS